MPILTNVVITSYCACILCCGPKATGLTASGRLPRTGITIAASRSIPFGTKVVIAGHTYIVEDRLAKRYDARIDIFMASHAEAKKFGIRTNNVTILITKP